MKWNEMEERKKNKRKSEFIKYENQQDGVRAIR